MRSVLLAAAAALLSAGGCAASQITPTFAMYSEHQQALLVQLTDDKGDTEECEWFWNLFRKSSSQVCSTKHHRSHSWVTVGDDHRAAAFPADGAVDDSVLGRECVLDGEEVRCDDQRIKAYDDRVVVESGRRIEACERAQRVAGGYACIAGGVTTPGHFYFRPDGGLAVSLPAEALSVAIDGRSATVVHHDAYGVRVVTVALDAAELRTLRVRELAVDPSDLAPSLEPIFDVTPSGSHVMVRRAHGCDVVEVETGRFAHEASCGRFVGDIAYVIPGVGAELVMLGTHARTAIGDVLSVHGVDATAMLGRDANRVVVIRRADAAVAAVTVGALADRIVVSDRTIAAIGVTADRPSRVALIDRASMTSRVVEVSSTVRSVIGIAARPGGDVVLLGVRSEDKKLPPTVLALSAAGEQRETVRLGAAR